MVSNSREVWETNYKSMGLEQLGSEAARVANGTVPDPDKDAKLAYLGREYARKTLNPPQDGIEVPKSDYERWCDIIAATPSRT